MYAEENIDDETCKRNKDEIKTIIWTKIIYKPNKMLRQKKLIKNKYDTKTMAENTTHIYAPKHVYT